MSAPTRQPLKIARPSPALANVAADVAGMTETDPNRIGGRVFWWGWVGFVMVVAGVNLLDVLTRLHDGRANGVVEPAWRAITDEYSSGLIWALIYPAIWRMARAARPWEGRPARSAALHAGGALGFSALHVGSFVVIRKAVWAILGQDYHFGGVGSFFYELPKDVVTYCLAVALIWGIGRMFEGQPQPAARAGASTFDIRDGAKVMRVRIDDILAVRSAGNYVEFLLADGRAPLMRATLAGVEAQLRPHGVTRTHRSWLVNIGRIEEIGPAGSGDYRLSLKGGVEAPLSRRFRPSLKPAEG